MPESVRQRTNRMSDQRESREIYMLIEALRLDLEALRVLLNTHVHSGVTTGGGNTGAPTSTIAALNTQP